MHSLLASWLPAVPTWYFCYAQWFLLSGPQIHVVTSKSAHPVFLAVIQAPSLLLQTKIRALPSLWIMSSFLPERRWTSPIWMLGLRYRERVNYTNSVSPLCVLMRDIFIGHLWRKYHLRLPAMGGTSDFRIRSEHPGFWSFWPCARWSRTSLVGREGEQWGHD